MILLFASVVALLLGPLLVTVSGKRQGPLAFLDGFVVVALAGLLLVDVLPHLVEQAGGWALLAAVAGFLLLPLVEGRLHDHSHGHSHAGHDHSGHDHAGHDHAGHDHVGHAHHDEDAHPHGHDPAEHEHAGAEDAASSKPRVDGLLLAAGLALAIHALMDGAALASAEQHDHHHHETALALGVLLHRLPLGLAIWLLLGSAGKRRRALALLAAIGVATAAGFAAHGFILAELALEPLAVFQALVAGSLLHVVVSHPPRAAASRGANMRGMAALGAVAAAAALYFGAGDHSTTMAGVGGVFLRLAAESAPALLLAFVAAGLMRGLLTRRSIGWLAGGGSALQATKGVVFGLPLPICSCGVLPVYRTLVLGGVPATAALAFLIATPEIGVDAVLISIPLLGVELALLRLVCAALVALAVGVAVGRWLERQAVTVEEQPLPTNAAPLGERLVSGLRFGLSELVDHIGPWIVLGLGIAALAEPLLRPEWLALLPRGSDVPLLALIGMPSYVCASGATPLAAVLIGKGVSPGAVIAFLLTGPATNVTTFAVLSALHGRRAALWFGAAVAALALGLGWIVNAVGVDVAKLSLGEAHAASPTLLQMAALACLGLLALGSLWRQGPRGVIAQVVAPHGEGVEGHGHSHAHAH